MFTGRFKKIWDRTDQELEVGISHAIVALDKLVPEQDGGRDLFYAILTGIDSYFEKRRRKDGIGLQPAALNTTVDDQTKGENT